MAITTPLCRQLGVEHPIFAFSHSVEVTIQVTLAGGFAVLGVARDHPDHISQMISEVRAAVGRRRFGVDLMFPKLNSNETSLADLKEEAASLPHQVRARVGCKVPGSPSHQAAFLH
jgi:hypothetical protein